MKTSFILIALMLMAGTAWAQIEEPSSAAGNLKRFNCTVNGVDQSVKTEAECTALGGNVTLIPSAATQR